MPRSRCWTPTLRWWWGSGSISHLAQRPRRRSSSGVRAGPFLSQEAALARVRAANGKEIELIEAQLLSEAAARAQVSACATFFGHPDGVWVLMVRGKFEDAERTMQLLLDAESGEQLCGEELSSPPPTDHMPP